MSTRKPRTSQPSRTNNQVQWQPIIIALIPVIGTIIAAYFAFRGTIASTLIPIEITQTAEARATTNALMALTSITGISPTIVAATNTPVNTPVISPTPVFSRTNNIQNPVQIPNKMVRVDEGDFTMGSKDSNDDDSNTEHEVFLSSYWIDRYEVTNEDYKVFVNQTHHSPPSYWKNGDYPLGRDKYPVVNVSWYDAKSYCEFVRKRLPTEAEWEKAARGTDKRKWPWGNTWNDKKANTDEGRVDDSRPVGTYDGGISPYGAYDMAGNVWEWVSDWYDSNYYKESPKREPSVPPFGDFKVLRGGSWADSSSLSQSFIRLGVFPIDYTSGVVGFRCVCSLCNP